MDEEWRNRIEQNPKVLVGKPVVRGTRLSVELIIGMLAGGWSHQDLLDNYPSLQDADILACLHYVHEMLESQRYYPVSA